jgi:hypothetical protein
VSSKAFVYSELQTLGLFGNLPWRELNHDLRNQPGFRNKTWLAGVGTGLLGGFYEFESLEAAKVFALDFIPRKARSLGMPQTTRLFDGTLSEEASRDMGSVHFGAPPPQLPGAFVYTEVQISVPFADVPWRAMNPVLKRQPGILAKTWLSGRNTNSAGGFYAFDTVENASAFCLNYFPTEAAGLGAAFTTRVFDAKPMEQASRDLRSPFYA